MGFNPDQIAMVDFNQFNEFGAFKSELLKHSEIQAVSLLGGSVPGKEEVIENGFAPKGTPPRSNSGSVSCLRATILKRYWTWNFFKVIHFKLEVRPIPLATS